MKQQEKSCIQKNYAPIYQLAHITYKMSVVHRSLAVAHRLEQFENCPTNKEKRMQRIVAPL